MINLSRISLTLGTQPLFEDLSATFQSGQKIGLVGRNGAGKSTLLKLIAGFQPFDEGKIQLDKTKTIAYMPQKMVLLSTKSVLQEVLDADQEYKKAKERKIFIDAQLEKEDVSEQLLEEYANIHEKLAHIDESKLLQRAQGILQGLGFSPAMQEQSVSVLSVGWKMRVILAQLLFCQADFYLFDEPTNHLDIASKEWFLDFLKRTSCGYLLVSHDQYFLEKVCSHIYELERGNGTIYSGTFSDYVRQKEERLTITRATHERQQKEIAKKQETIDRFRAKSSKAKMAQSMMKQLERIEVIEVEPPLPVVSFSFPPVQRAGAIVLQTKNISYAFENKKIFEHIFVDIGRGNKVALVAANGMGKTTFLSIVVNKLPLQHGSFEFGYNVSYAFFEQDQARALDPEKTILETLKTKCPKATEQTIRAMLGNFLFSGEAVYKKIHMLSGGEKNRVAMASVLLQNANFLILDEPTNHLDIYAKQILLQALKKYEGTIFFVSHDQTFIQELATHILELTPKSAYLYHGTYQDYYTQKHQAKSNVVEKKETPKVITEPLDNKELVALKKKLNSLESKINKLEQKEKTLQQEFAAVHYGTDAFNALQEQYSAVKKDLELSLQEWELQYKGLSEFK